MGQTILSILLSCQKKRTDGINGIQKKADRITGLTGFGLSFYPVEGFLSLPLRFDSGIAKSLGCSA